MTEIDINNKSDIVEKFRKVFALTTSSNEGEAQAAMLMAQKMMVEYNLSMSDVSMGEINKKEVINESISQSSRSAWWHQHLASIIADNFKCGIYIHRSRSNGITNIKYIGLKNDVEIAKQVYLYAVEAISFSYKKYIRENSYRDNKQGIKNQYIYGYLEGLKAKFAEQVKNNEWGLVIVKDKVVNDAIDNLNLRKGGKRHINTNGNEVDRSSGYEDGKKFNIISGQLK